MDSASISSLFILQITNPSSHPQISYFLIKPGKSYSLGRKSKNDIVVNHPSVSRLHLMLEWDELGVRVQDMQTRNGTYLNGKRLLNKVALSVGEVIEISAIKIQLVLPEPAILEALGRRTADLSSVNIQSSSAVQAKLVLVNSEPGFVRPNHSIQARVQSLIRFCTKKQNVKNVLIFSVSCLIGLLLFFGFVYWM